MADINEIDTGDVIRIMVATDNHLGYAEKDAVRGNDSFIAFEEMLQLAVEEDVDLILLGGDLFHDAVPSQNSLNKCMQLLRRYTFGDKPVKLEILSDQSLNFHNAANQSVNYEDPNLNVAIPVFSIHGNHDDPSGFGRLSSLDLLSATGLVNYFGRWTDLTQIEINPIMLRKGQSHMALYGLSHIHDARLCRLFDNYKVAVACPAEADDDWFHLMVVHQNRADRGPKNYLPEEALPGFLNLVVWGHEHDCRIEPEFNVKRDFYVSQPGSSVATSLAEGESLKKHVAILEVFKNKFQLKPLPLQTVRPFVFESVDLNDYVSELNLEEGDAAEKVSKFAEKLIVEMIERSQDLITGHPKQPTLPLIRLRLVYNNEAFMFNTIRFGQMFSKRLANPSDVVHFKRLIKRMKTEGTEGIDKEAMKRAFDKMEADNTSRVEEYVVRYFEEVGERKPLKVLPPKALSEITFRLVERRDTIAAENMVKIYKEKAIDHLMETLPADEDIDEELRSFLNEFTFDDMLKTLDERDNKNGVGSYDGSKTEPKRTTSSVASSSPASSLGNVTKTSTASVGSTRGGGRGGRGRGRAASTRAAASSTRSGRAMPQLNVTVTDGKSESTSSRQDTLLNSLSRSRQACSKKPVYVISDDSE